MGLFLNITKNPSSFLRIHIYSRIGVILILILLCSISAGQAEEQIYIHQNSSVSILNGTYISLAGDLQIEGSINTDEESGIHFSGSTSQVIKSSIKLKLGTLQLENPNGLVTLCPVQIRHELNLVNGALEIKGGNLILDKGSLLKWTSASSYIKATDHFVEIAGLDTNNISVPLGRTQLKQFPLIVHSQKSTINFKCKILPGPHENYDENSSPAGRRITSECVENVWIIRTDPQNEKIHISMGFNSVSENSGFDKSNVNIYQFEESWKLISGPTASLGNNPFFIKTVLDQNRKQSIIALGSNQFSTDLNKIETALIYPNPNYGEFSIIVNEDFLDGHLYLYNELGEKVYDSRIQSSIQLHSLNNLLAGVYFVELNAGENYISKKLIILEP